MNGDSTKERGCFIYMCGRFSSCSIDVDDINRLAERPKKDWNIDFNSRIESSLEIMESTVTVRRG